MEREWLCYRCGKFMEGEFSYCRGGHFNGGRMVMLQKWSLYWRENGHVTMWSVLWRKNVHFTEVLTLMDICIFYCILWSIVVFCFLYIYSISYL